MNTFLSVKNLSKSFYKEKVLDNLNFEVQRGKILAILGSSGCGKSTTLRIISGLIKQDSGQVWLNGNRIDNTPANKRNIGFVFQNYSLFPYMNVRKNVEFGMRIRRITPEIRCKKVEELLSLMHLEGLEKRKPGQLSGGQQQRVALARALAIEPKLLLLDEPFGALDAKIRRKLRRDLKVLQKELGITMVFVTHDQEEAFEVGDQVAIMNDGRIEQIGLPRDLYDNPKTNFVAKFVGNMNVLRLPIQNPISKKEREVMVRPEDIIIKKYRGEKNSNELCGVLTSYIFLGPIIEAIVLLENKDVLVALLSKHQFIKKALRRGDKLSVKITKYRTLPKG